MPSLSQPCAPEQAPSQAAPPGPARWGKQEWLLAMLLAGAVVVTFGFVVECDFVNYDDDAYLMNNPHLRAGLSWDSLAWAVTTVHFSIWHPVVWWTFLLDYQLYGFQHPGGYHLTNLLWHLGSTLLLFAALRRMTGATWLSFLVAALFAVHPLNVQPVAWIAERKGVVSAFFWMLTLWAYARYAERPGGARYALVCAGLALGLMSKQTVMTLPCALLLLDVWPLGRWRPGAPGLGRLVLEKLPLLALSTVVAIFTLFLQRSTGAQASLEHISAAARVKNALVSYVIYLGQALLPLNLAPYYPHPGDRLSLAAALLAGLFLLAVTAGVLWQLHRRPYLAVGWCWYLGTLLPVSGLVQLGSYARADRYAYIPLVGIFFAVVWGLAEVARRRHLERLLGALAVLVLGGFAIATWREVHYWQNSALLWEHALQVTTPSSVAYNNRGSALMKKDKDLAIESFREAIRLGAGNQAAHLNLALLLMERGDLAGAATHFQETIRLAPDNAAAQTAHGNLGRILMDRGETVKAGEHFQTALGINPNSARAQADLGEYLAYQGKEEQADAYFRKALELEPDNPAIELTIGTRLLNLDRLDEAALHLERAVRLDDKGHAAAKLWEMGLAHLAQEKTARALVCLRCLAAVHPGHAAVRRELAYALEREGQAEQAQTEYQASLRLDPGWPAAVRSAAWALATDPDPRRRDAKQALRLALQVAQAQGEQDPHVADTLAAAYAEAGRYAEAATMARQAVARARALGASALAHAIEERLRLYEQKQPYRRPPP